MHSRRYKEHVSTFFYKRHTIKYEMLLQLWYITSVLKSLFFCTTTILQILMKGHFPFILWYTNIKQLSLIYVYWRIAEQKFMAIKKEVVS